MHFADFEIVPCPVLQTLLPESDNMSESDVAAISAELAVKQSAALRYDLTAKSIRVNLQRTLAKTKWAERLAEILKRGANEFERMDVNAQQQAVAATEDVMRLTKALSAAKLAAGSPAAVPQSSNYESVPNKLSTSKVTLVLSTSLNDVFEEMSLCTAPTIYDFQGQKMQFTEGDDPCHPYITSNGVTWRNGSIELADDQILYISGADVVLESVHINGGVQGVHVKEGGSLTMKACEVNGAQHGVVLSGNGFLLATGLHLNCCITSGVWLSNNSTADLTDGSISDSFGIAVRGDDSSYMMGRNVDISCDCDTVRLCDDAKVSLQGCTLSGIAGCVDDQAILVLSYCHYVFCDERNEWDLDQFQGSGTVVIEDDN